MAEGLMVTGTALSVWGQLEETNAQAKAAQDQATLRDIEARETLERAKINEQSILKERDVTFSAQTAGFAAGNVDVTTGTPLMVMEATGAFYREEVANMKREANFRAGQLQSEAGSYRESADSTRKVGAIKIAGSLLTSGAAYADAKNKK